MLFYLVVNGGLKQTSQGAALNCCVWIDAPLASGDGGVPSTGLVAVFIFMNMCRNLTVVGFGAGTRGSSYHYFDGLGSRTSGGAVCLYSDHTRARDCLITEYPVHRSHTRA